MKLQINEEYRLNSDKYNIILEKRLTAKKGKKVGEEYYIQVGFYPSLEAALQGFVKQSISCSNAEGIDCILSEIQSIHGTIRELKIEIGKVSKGNIMK